MKVFRAIPLLLAVLAASCGLFPTSVEAIRRNPRGYDGKTVTVSGEVKEATSLVVAKFFVIDDGTGSITVVTDRPLPKVGTHARVRGVVHEEFSIGDKHFLVLEERSAGGG